jgi:hypothetical protein|eukprot:COSAG06_NODE_884_length_11783_cov_10.515919_15_plen_165_part_00
MHCGSWFTASTSFEVTRSIVKLSICLMSLPITNCTCTLTCTRNKTKAAVFRQFPSVCPEPVLAKRSRCFNSNHEIGSFRQLPAANGASIKNLFAPVLRGLSRGSTEKRPFFSTDRFYCNMARTKGVFRTCARFCDGVCAPRHLLEFCYICPEPVLATRQLYWDL